MYNARTRFRLLSNIFFGCLVGVSLCGTASARITGSFLFLYDLTEEDGKWSGDSEQRINLSMRGATGLERLLGLNLGLIRREGEWDFLGGLTPTYAINLQGKHYKLSSGYSVRTRREIDIINAQSYGNLSVFLPSLPVFRLAYSRQGVRGSLEKSRLDSTGTSAQLSVEDELGPFRIRLNRREYSSENPARGPEYDTKSTDTSGDVDFAYSYRQLLSFNGRFRMGWLDTERTLTGKTKSETQDLSLGFRISPVSTIALSGTTAIRRQQRESSGTQKSMPVINSDSSANRLQLMLQPIEGMILNAAYSINDTFREEGTPLSNETRSLTVNLKPRRSLTFTGYFMIYDSQERETRLSTSRRNSFDLRAEILNGLQVSSRLDLSESENFVSGIISDRDSVTTRLEAMLTERFRSNIIYDWQKHRRRSGGEVEDETQHRVTLTGSYFFARMLNMDFRYSRSMSIEWKDSSASSAFGIRYSIGESHFSLRYNQLSSPGRSDSLSDVGQRTTRTFTLAFDQEVGRNTDLTLSYEIWSGERQAGRRGTRRFSFRANTRF